MVVEDEVESYSSTSTTLLPGHGLLGTKPFWWGTDGILVDTLTSSDEQLHLSLITLLHIMTFKVAHYTYRVRSDIQA